MGRGMKRLQQRWCAAFGQIWVQPARATDGAGCGRPPLPWIPLVVVEAQRRWLVGVLVGIQSSRRLDDDGRADGLPGEYSWRSAVVLGAPLAGGRVCVGGLARCYVGR